MRVSCNWLSRHVDLSGINLHDLGRRFTMAVAELDGIEELGQGLDLVVVGHVLEVQGLEGKKVRLTKVDCGPVHGIRQIICGAANVAEGQYVAVALPGQRLGDLEIQVSKVAGIESFGMICSERELGLSEENAGIMTLEGAGLVPGTPLAEALPEIKDTIFILDNKSLTHRPDCWGHRGIAREVAALLDRPLQPLTPKVTYTEARPLTITVEDQKSCPRYAAAVMDKVEVKRSPLWLRLLLNRTGMRPINTLVDATNYVMLDLGNPLHAFDARFIANNTIKVRRAQEGEAFTTLDGQARTLSAQDLVIADAERPVALAGVMGGLDSEIKDDTTSLVLEAANFDAARIRTTAVRHGLRTEASSRYEKSLDPRLVELAAASFFALVQELCPAATVTSALHDVHAPFAEPTIISTSVAYIEERLGYPVGQELILKILSGLEFGVEVGEAGQLTVTVPSYRATKDISIQDDLVEEVGRVFGYDNIPPSAPLVPVARPEPNKKKKFESLTRSHLSLAFGLDEIQSYSFDDETFLARMGANQPERVRLQNPISQDEPFLRVDLVPHLLKALEKNARNFNEIGLFELGRVYLPQPTDIPEQPGRLAILLAAKGQTPQTSFAAAKALVLSLAKALERQAPALIPQGVTHAWAHPVRQARLQLPGVENFGYIAELHPAALHKLGLDHQGVVVELNLDAWRESTIQATGYRALPRFPAVYRDFAALVTKDTPAESMRQAIAQAVPELIEAVGFESVYAGQGVPEGFKSLAWSVTFRRTDRTLQEAEIRDAEARIWEALTAIGAKQRA